MFNGPGMVAGTNPTIDHHPGVAAMIPARITVWAGFVNAMIGAVSH
jgi:hypothetical protein